MLVDRHIARSLLFLGRCFCRQALLFFFLPSGFASGFFLGLLRDNLLAVGLSGLEQRRERKIKTAAIAAVTSRPFHGIRTCFWKFQV